MRIVRDFQQIKLREFKWDTSFEKLNMDSLDRINMITSIEYEFHTVFSDNVMDSFKSPADVINFMAKDPSVY